MLTRSTQHGDRPGWHRQVDIGEGSTRLLAAINPGKGADRVEVFYRTQRMADEGRAWFDRVACAAVVFLTREIVDPAGAMSLGEVSRATPAPADTLPPEVIAQAVEQLLRRHYANWCDEPIPLLGDKTPRQAIATPSGLERVKGLLREYEDGERRQNQAQGRPARSVQFLWDALGISR